MSKKNRNSERPRGPAATPGDTASSGAPPQSVCPTCKGTGFEPTAWEQREGLKASLLGWMWEEGRVDELIASFEPNEIIEHVYLFTVEIRKPDGTKRVFYRTPRKEPVASVADTGEFVR